MTKFYFHFLFCLFSVAYFFEVPVYGQIRSQRVANYTMSVLFKPEEQILNGKMRLRWTNTSRDTVNSLQFHLAWNAFKNSKSTYMRQLPVSQWPKTAQQWGYIAISSCKVQEGENLTNKLTFIQPDDNNTDDQTVASVQLWKPLAPKETITLLIDFSAKIPALIEETGYSNDFFLFANWFPKIGVYRSTATQKTGEWLCQQYRPNTSFLSDFGLYDITINLPANYQVAAPGTLVEDKQTDDLRQLHYRAEDMADFVWAASKNWYLLEDDDSKATHIRLFMQKEHQREAERYMQAIESALAYYQENLGDYPYPALTVVDLPYQAMHLRQPAAPAFVTAYMLKPLPGIVRLPESRIAGALAYQYFSALMGNAQDRWLTEGLRAYYENRLMAERYGADGAFINILDFKVDKLALFRHIFMANEQTGHMLLNHINTTQAALWLNTLEGLLGHATMDNVLQRYYQQWQFKQPALTDFIAIVNASAGGQQTTAIRFDVKAFFNQLLEANHYCDYKVVSIENKAQSPEKGFFYAKGQLSYKNEDELNSDLTMYDCRVRLERKGNISLPVTILVSFSNGEQRTEYWNTKTQYLELYYQGTTTIKSVEIDPQRKMLIDNNRINNSLTLSPDKRPLWRMSAKMLFLTQNILQFFGTLI